MKIEISLFGKNYSANLNRPLDISIPLSPTGPKAWYVNPMSIDPVRTDRFTGSVAEGGNVNFRNIFFNPHGHGTHTESVGHIDEAVTSVNKTLQQYFFSALLVSLNPTTISEPTMEYQEIGDRVVTMQQIQDAVGTLNCEALILRTLPNTKEKNTLEYSSTNPPYLQPEALSYMREKGVKHLLLDLPSVDRETDGGRLLAHRAFWKGGRADDEECTITEMIFVKDEIKDGPYLLNLQTAPFENDATPSRPILFKLEN